MNLLTALIALPLAAALIIALIPANYRFVVRLLALATTLATAILALALFWNF